MPFVSNQGTKIHYRVEGSGACLFVQHGFTQNLELWRKSGFTAAIGADVRLVLLDARGHGQSDKPHDARSYSWNDRISDVIAVADELEVDRFDFLGYSMGGFYGYYLAKTFPDRLNSLVIGGAGPSAELSERDPRFDAFNDIDGSDPSAFMTAFESTIGEKLPAARRARIVSNDLRALVASIKARQLQEPIYESLGSMTTPCLLYAGESDVVFAATKSAANKIPNARFLSIPGASHMEAFVRSAELAPEIRRFFRESLVR